eukprot:6205268-Pleurochrysis_carterae.AAC.1
MTGRNGHSKNRTKSGCDARRWPFLESHLFQPISTYDCKSHLNLACAAPTYSFVIPQRLCSSQIACFV